MRTFAVDGLSEVRVVAPVSTVCPFDHEADRSVLTITYRPTTRCVELSCLHGYLDGYAVEEISHEALVGRVRADLAKTLAPAWITVEDVFSYHDTTLAVRSGERP